jgi:valyl-tRNA synthetase
VTDPLDLAMLGRLGRVVGRCTAAFEDYDQAGALESAEQFFWQFCDDYLELVKPRAYAAEHDQQGAGSAVTALRCALSVLLRLFAPVLPFVTEEVWSWWNEGSIHRAPWPRADELPLVATEPDGAGLDAAAAAIGAIRKAKSGAGLSQKAGIALLIVRGRDQELQLLRSVLADVVAAGHVGAVEMIATQDDTQYQVIF